MRSTTTSANTEKQPGAFRRLRARTGACAAAGGAWRTRERD
ncbi:hypothetical protein HMPREF0298_0047, partial [Corynebacterium lipophiloflavum DSM 44291]